MRRGVWLLGLGVLSALLGVASARASAAETTTGTTTTTTTATTAPSYAQLATSPLPAGCIGAGAAAVVRPSRPVVALGTPAFDTGPSSYPASNSAVAFDSMTVSGWTCRSDRVTLASVSLFEGAVTASSVEATNGRGTVAGLEIGGNAVSATAGQTVAVESWGQLTLGETIGRLTAPLVLRLLQTHDGFVAGTRIAIAFSATSLPVVKPTVKHGSSSGTEPGQGTPVESGRAKDPSTAKRHGRKQPAKPPPDFPASADPILADGGLTRAAQHSPVVSTAMRYLGVPYLWGGASPKTGFDCSGLVKYVFAQLGVSLPHYAASQWYSPDGVWVAPNRLRPGDLVFFIGSDGTRKAPGHVGIYVGGGYLIDAPHTGSFVRIDSLDERPFANQYVGARRIVSQLDTRHLLHVTKPGEPATAVPTGFPSLSAIGPFGGRLGIVAVSAPVVRSSSHGYWIWTGVFVACLLLLGGGLLVRRDRLHAAKGLIVGNLSSPSSRWRRKRATPTSPVKSE